MSSFDHTYQNPITSIPSADPFVLKHAGEYWAYVTGEWQDGRYFGILHSKDLVNWEARAGALAPLKPPEAYDYTCYWAPEVTYENGLFYLYYSVGDEVHMHIRVATSTTPDGPFTDSGHRLTSEKFAIDAHVFVDDDGSRYLFYAADFLDHTHIGTGIVVDRMLDAYHLAGNPQPVARARFDWQVYDPNRAEKGGVRWHTVEGPFMLKRKGRYYLMFSGGNWQTDSYGLGYAFSDSMDAAQEWHQPCDAIHTPQILKSNQAQGVIGPGHNSVVRGPDNRQLYCVYHRWNHKVGARVMAIDRLEWIGDRLAVLGPSTGEEVYVQTPDVQHGTFKGKQTFELPQPAPSFTAEMTVRLLVSQEAFGLHLRSGEADLLVMRIHSEGEKITVQTPHGEQVKQLPAGFRADVNHLIRIEVNGRVVSLYLDDALFAWRGLIQIPPTEMALVSATRGEYTGFAMTPGWEDIFEQEYSLEDLGWVDDAEGGAWESSDGQLQQTNPSAGQSRIMKRIAFTAEAYEFVVNARLAEGSPAGGYYTCYPAASDEKAGPAFSIQAAQGGWELAATGGSLPQAAQLPADFDPYQYQHFRFHVLPGQIQAFLENRLLLSIPFEGDAAQVGLGTVDAQAAFDLARVTRLS
jgi:GH43 family beta-xylosidase